MSEQTPGSATGAAPDKPAVGGPEGTASEAVDWQARALAAEESFSNLQPEYTRATQEAAAQREALQWYELMISTDDPDLRRQAADALGFEVPEEDKPPDEGDQDPFEQYDARIQTLEERDAARDAQQQEAENVRQVRAVLDAQLEELVPGAQHPDPDVAKGVKFDQDQVLAYAINALPVGEDGLPQVALAHQLWSQRNDARQQDWARSKRAPMFSPGGQTATEVPNLDNDQERQDYMTRRLHGQHGALRMSFVVVSEPGRDEGGRQPLHREQTWLSRPPPPWWTS